MLRVGTAWRWRVNHTDSSEIKEKQPFGLSDVPYRQAIHEHIEVKTS